MAMASAAGKRPASRLLYESGEWTFDAVQRFGFLELDPRPLRTGEELYIPQHPRGMPTMIAMADPDEFGRTAAFLLSPAASYLTGIMVPVDGGMRHGF